MIVLYLVNQNTVLECSKFKKVFFDIGGELVQCLCCILYGFYCLSFLALSVVLVNGISLLETREV